MTQKEREFYGATRRNAKAIWTALHDAKNLQDQWNALDYGNTLSAGDNFDAGITKSELGPVIFDTFNALQAVLDANGGGLSGNLAKVI